MPIRQLKDFQSFPSFNGLQIDNWESAKLLACFCRHITSITIQSFRKLWPAWAPRAFPEALFAKRPALEEAPSLGLPAEFRNGAGQLPADPQGIVAACRTALLGKWCRLASAITYRDSWDRSCQSLRKPRPIGAGSKRFPSAYERISCLPCYWVILCFIHLYSRKIEWRITSLRAIWFHFRYFLCSKKCAFKRHAASLRGIHEIQLSGGFPFSQFQCFGVVFLTS